MRAVVDAGENPGELNVPFFVLFVPLGFPALRHLRGWRPRWRNKVSHV